MKNSALLLFLLLFIASAGYAQNDFSSYFEKRTLRIDFSLTGNDSIQQAAVQQLREEPVWGGPVKNMEDPFGYGGYYINVYDLASGKKIYSRGFNTLFEEWRTTDQAKVETQSWNNSVSVPFPKKPVRVELCARDKSDMEFHPIVTQTPDVSLKHCSIRHPSENSNQILMYGLFAFRLRRVAWMFRATVSGITLL